MNKFHDLIIVGGGIVGAATARQVKISFPRLSVLLLEKEHEYSLHQTGHNSGVIHAGIYYIPGTLKAKLCVEGAQKIFRYCDENKVPYKKPGKIIVATRQEEVEIVEKLFERTKKLGVKDLRLIDAAEIKALEPNCEGIKAIHSPNTGIIDFGVLTRSFVKDFCKRGGEAMTGVEVEAFRDTSTLLKTKESATYPVTVVGKDNKIFHSRWAVTCGGLQSDRLSVMTGCSHFPKIVPFRGEYLILKPERSNLVKMNIYPPPDPHLPFLGVHFTPRMDGGVWLGPNAVVALSREKYARWPVDFNLNDVMDYAFFPGLYTLAKKHFMYGVNETLRSLSLSAQVKELQRFVPQLHVEDVVRGPVGIRAQAVDKNGSLVDDFTFDRGNKPGINSLVLHVRNAPSPAATSSMGIAELITERINADFGLAKLSQSK